MMSHKWNTLDPVNEEACLSPEGEAVRGQINERIARLAAARAKYDADAAALRSSRPGHMTTKQARDLEEMPTRNFALLRDELDIRILIDEQWAPAYDAAQLANRQRLFEALEKAKAEVRQRLIGIGYAEDRIAGTEVISILPDTLLRHPTVYALTMEQGAADRRPIFDDFLKNNRQLIGELEQQLQEHVGRLTSKI